VPCICQHLKQMSSKVKEIDVDCFSILPRVISVAHYPDTLYIIWQKILQPHVSRVVTCPRFECMATEIIHSNNTGSTLALVSELWVGGRSATYSAMWFISRGVERCEIIKMIIDIHSCALPSTESSN
jgi:hypothetical protein